MTDCGADGQIRAANTRISKKGRASTLDRPIQHLYPLEVASPLDATLDDLDNTGNDKSNIEQQAANPLQCFPQRHAITWRIPGDKSVGYEFI